MKKLLIVVIYLVIQLNLNAFEFIKIEEKAYEKIDSNFFGNGYSKICNLESDLLFFDSQSYQKLNLIDYSWEIINQKGNGPGEFGFPSKFIKIKETYYCIDNKKNALITYDKNWKFIKEKRLKYSPNNIFKVSSGSYAILFDILKGQDIICIYNENGKLIDSFLNEDELCFKNSKKKQINAYTNSTSFKQKDKLYIFLQGVSLIHEIDFSKKTSTISDYSNDLSFNPSRYYMKKKSISPLYIINGLSGKDYKSYKYFLVMNRRSLEEKLNNASFYIIKFNIKENIIEDVSNLDDWGSKLLYHSIMLEDILYVFNNDDLVLEKYKIKEIE